MTTFERFPAGGDFTIGLACVIALGAAALAGRTMAEPQRGATPQATEEATAISVANAMVPFVADIPGGLANSAAVGSANPEIRIDSLATSGSFVVRSILVKTSFPATGIRFLSANSMVLNGVLFATSTDSLVGHLGSAVMESADLMGTPIRTGGIGDDMPGGCFPHELIVESAGFDDDVIIQLFARSDDVDMHIHTIRVAGYKRPGDTIQVTYVPGS